MGLYPLIKTTIFLLFVFLVSSCGTTATITEFDVPEQEYLIEAENEHITEKTEEKEQVPMFVYEGRILNIFFHVLVARPETAFTSERKNHFLDWYVTANEYKKILYELYIGDYVLIDIKELYEVNYINGRKTISGKKPLVPEGKKPMVLSIDDLNYYPTVRRLASVHKLVLNERGEIAAWTDSPTGGELSYDLDVVTYLEEFIKKYPDFSVRGARGVIGVTGDEGVLGYQTQKTGVPEYQEEKKNAITVVNKLKELGWHFASHSWGHPNLPNISMKNFIDDANLWDKEVRPIVGDTDIFIYPFGAGVEHQEEKHAELRKRGFIVFLDVGGGYGYRLEQDYIYFNRRNIDGVYFRTVTNPAHRLFDFDKVIDKDARRGIFPGL